MPAIRLRRNPKRFRLFRYLSAIILNFLRDPMTFSFTTLWEERERLCFFCSFVKGVFFVFLMGVWLFWWYFWMPWYPLSVLTLLSGWMGSLEVLKRLKSCCFPFPKQVQTTRFVDFWTTICAFIVWRFFLPE